MGLLLRATFILAAFNLTVILTLLLMNNNVMNNHKTIEASQFQRWPRKNGRQLLIENLDRKRSHKRYFKKLCELDKIRLVKLENTDLKVQSSIELIERFHEFIMDPQNLVCAENKDSEGNIIPDVTIPMALNWSVWTSY